MPIPDGNFDTCQSSRALERWDDDNVRLLFVCYQKFKGLLGKSYHTKKSVFDKIAEEFNLQSSNLVVTGDQCLRKWKKMETKHKEVEDNNKQTGRAKKTWKFEKEMEQCIGGNASVRPVFTFDTGSPSSSTSLSSPCSAEIDEGSDEDSESSSDKSGDKGKRPASSKVEKRKPLKRKRKSHSSASEMLEFLREYGEKRERVEEEKIYLLKTMQQEKNVFFGELLNCLKDKNKK